MTRSPCALVSLVALALALASPIPADAASEAAEIPDWLRAHMGTADGQIAPIVLERARALYQAQAGEAGIANPCYFAKDATRPSAASDGAPGPRFYIICEEAETFRAVHSGHGSGRSLPEADFSNAQDCARNFSNAEGSNLTMGGAYLTAETRTSFKGYFTEGGARVPFHRTFLLFDGMGETGNARERAIGGHVATFLRWRCRIEDPESPNADAEGFVPYGSLVNYTGGRSNGCTTWSEEVSEEIIALVEGNPTTLYIYPESRDIEAVAEAVDARRPLSEAGLYWNAACLDAIVAPIFRPKESLQPVIDRWRQSLPPARPLELPPCR
ncbi:MAG: hypothetical protein ACOCY0_03045 [Roseicyclus sp.]